MNNIHSIMNRNKGMWVSAVVVLVLAALVIWWIVDRRPLSSTTEPGAVATSTEGSSTTGGSTGVTRVSRANQTVSTIVAGLSGTSQFNALFSSTGVGASLSSTGKYTVFVPTNGAFGQLPGGTISNMSAAEKKRLVQYHVVSGRAIDVDAEISGTIEALSRDTLNFSYGPDKLPLVNSAIVITEYVGKNGIVYLIDNVLLPPKKAQGAL